MHHEQSNARARALEARLLLPEQPCYESAREAQRHIRALLIKAYAADKLRGDQQQVHRLLKLDENARLLAGGSRHDGAFHTRDAWERWGAFERDDGARFSFAITLSPNGRRVQVAAQSFTFGLPPWLGDGLTVMRWDLDVSGRLHADDGLRSHLHVHGDVRVPAAQMSPEELLELFLYRLARAPK